MMIWMMCTGQMRMACLRKKLSKGSEILKSRGDRQVTMRVTDCNSAIWQPVLACAPSKLSYIHVKITDWPQID